MGTLEQEFFIAQIKTQVSHIEDPAELRTIIEALIRLMQSQRQAFLSAMTAEKELED
jgi:hypothetical protein